MSAGTESAVNHPRTVSQALIQLLSGYGINTAFRIPGTHTLELYRALGQEGIRHVQCRNEQGASLMADGYARVAGKPALCTIVSGPGVTNATTGIAQAYCDSVPMVVIAAAASSVSQGKGWGTVHDLNDQRAVTAGFTGFSAMIVDPEELPELVARAFGLFRSSRPRPVHFSIPHDLLGKPELREWKARRAPAKPMPDPAAIQEAALLLSKAATPLILIGGGAIGTRDSLTRIAERLGAPVLTTNAGKGILPESHRLSLGCSILQRASQEALANSDVVLLVGSEVAEGDHFQPKLAIEGKIIRIDIDPVELTSVYGAAVGIQSDAAAALSALSVELERYENPRGAAAGIERARTIRAENAGTLSIAELRHARLWRTVRAALPDDTITFGDATQLVYTGSFALSVERERCWYYPGTYCSLGTALPMAIGAKIAAPSRPVMAVAGDGGFLFTINELATAAEEGLGLPILVWNNDALQEIADQMDRRAIPRIAVQPASPDFTLLARGFGCQGLRAESSAHLMKSIRQSFELSVPTVIEIPANARWIWES